MAKEFEIYTLSRFPLPRITVHWHPPTSLKPTEQIGGPARIEALRKAFAVWRGVVEQPSSAALRLADDCGRGVKARSCCIEALSEIAEMAWA